MKLLIHDLDEKTFQTIFPEPMEDMEVVSDDGTIRNCIGCFGCWVKTPGTCILKDSYTHMGEDIARSEEVILLSRCTYGGFSPFVKTVLDRSISYIHPYFETRNGEMHHRHRYDHQFTMKVWFYGEDIQEAEKETAKRLVKANSVNLDCLLKDITFVKDPLEIRDGVL